MKKDAKQNKTATLASVQGYHGGIWHSESYAFSGFKSRKYFTSDRFIPLDENYNRPDGKPLKGYGLEIETECTGLNNSTVYAEVLEKVIFPHFPADLFKMQHDGSLGGDCSAECITQVMTKEFIRNNYNAFKLMYNTYFPAFNISCSRTGACGMHVNISTACFGKSDEVRQNAIRKLYYIVNKQFNFCCALLNRNPARTGYCGQMRADMEYCKTLDLHRQGCSHNVSFNLGHYDAGRIEIRLVGGQKDFGCFRNTMECIFYLVDRVKSLSWAACDDVVQIFSGCNQYVFDRLNTKCRDAGTITTDELNKISASVIREELL